MRKIGDGYLAWMGEEIFSSFFTVPLLVRSVLSFGIGLAAFVTPDGWFRMGLILLFAAGGILSMIDIMGKGKKVSIWPIAYSILMFFLGIFVFFGCFLVIRTIPIVIMTLGVWVAASGVAQLVFMNFARSGESEGGLIVPAKWGTNSAVGALVIGLITIVLGALFSNQPDTGKVLFLQYPLGAMFMAYGVYELFTAFAVSKANRKHQEQ